ncbi:RcnB family protein [Sphingomonas endolithica]|jgi:Ni/Co efflux regulator RcnB|uniref:RcnB family protein n=1 Tax=Sphingomonas endolithica TaxID=2972485 RepID=UPI0021AE9589|nr:RcnB family protein [Sphingomonas sp. ZFBP2030]
MKKFILAALAASVALSPMAASVASAQGRQQERHTTIVKRNGNVVQKTVVRQRAPQYRSDWRRGQRFDQRQARNYRQIDYRQYRGLRAPPRGYRYVQSDRNVILVSNGGIISQIFSGLIR